MQHKRQPPPRPPRRGRGDVIGREKELTDLCELLDAVGQGQGHAVAVVGEPGIGKTRLVSALAARANTIATRSHTLPWATAQTRTVLDTARGLLAASTPLIERRGLTLIGVAVSNLDNDRAVQLELPFDAYGDGHLDGALDAVRDRFGGSAVTRATLLGRDQGMTVPLLPD